MVLVSAVSVSQGEPQCRSGFVGKNGGTDGEEAIERRCGQDVPAVTGRRRADRSNRLGGSRQGNSLRNHLFDFRLMYGQRMEGFEAYTVHGHTSKASISSEAACFEGADRLCCADTRFIRSQTC